MPYNMPTDVAVTNYILVGWWWYYWCGIDWLSESSHLQPKGPNKKKENATWKSG
jgi:hypothetical protein